MKIIHILQDITFDDLDFNVDNIENLVDTLCIPIRKNVINCPDIDNAPYVAINMNLGTVGVHAALCAEHDDDVDFLPIELSPAEHDFLHGVFVVY